MENKSEYIEIDILRLARALLRKLWLVILSACICGCGAFAYARFYISPTYSSSALMYVNNSSFSLGSTSFSISPSELSAAQNLVDTYLVILRTRSTLNAVIEKAELDYTYEELASMISASSVNETEIFRITATCKDPQEAKTIVNTIAEILPDRISSIVNGSSVKVVDYGVTPRFRSSPSYTRYVTMGLAIGFVLSCAVIVLLELLDDLVHNTDMLPGNGRIPILAEIPNLNASGSSYSYSRYGKSGGYGKSSGYGETQDEAV